MIPDPRHTAFLILKACQGNRTTLDQAIDQHQSQLAELGEKDRTLCNAIVFGVLRHQGELDHLIRAFSKRPFEQLDQNVVQILRLTAFQLRFLDRVPDFAAIHSGVELAKVLVGKNAAGFVNAVLRQLAKGHDKIALPDPLRQEGAYLKVKYSLPAWLGKRWTHRYGPEKTRNLAQTLMEIPLLTLRVNRLVSDRESLSQLLNQDGILSEPTVFSSQGLTLGHPGRAVRELPGYAQGFFQVQDEAAQLVGQVLNPKPHERILDACAGLGGKACHAAQLMENQGQVTATDIDPAKILALDQEAHRLGLSNIQGRALDIAGATVKDFQGYFDRVLVDAPCTGLGVIRRNPDTRWKRRAGDILRMAALQKRILNAAASLVRPGGILVYAVCSCEPEENEGVVDHFLSKRKDFEPDKGAISRLVPDFKGLDPVAFSLRTFPDPGNMDGFFVARMRRG